jgi:hypothetical protein
VATTCPHGLRADECLICPALPARTSAGAVTRHRGPGLHLLAAIAAIAVIGLVAWAVAGIVWALLHVLELIAVAALAGWAGYRLGHFRGSHQRKE